jgi:hypothetical protein
MRRTEVERLVHETPMRVKDNARYLSRSLLRGSIEWLVLPSRRLQGRPGNGESYCFLCVKGFISQRETISFALVRASA